jgi:deoxyribonuclease V
MLACTDVDYRASEVAAACVWFRDWADAAPSAEHVVVSSSPPAAYRPGRFFERELPYLLSVLDPLPDIVVVDAHVWLAGDDAGLGAHLYEALDRAHAVVGVAKQPFRDQTRAIPVLRGASKQPLYVTAIGMDVNEAADGVRRMHGAHRIPTLIKRADRLARDA